MPHREESSLFLQVARTNLQEKLGVIVDGCNEGWCILLAKIVSFPHCGA